MNTNFIKALVLLSILLGFNFANASSYRFKISQKGAVKAKCTANGVKQESRIKVDLSSGQLKQSVASVRFHVRICTSVGFVDFDPRVALPARFLRKFQFGSSFEDFSLSFSPSIMTPRKGRAASSVYIEDLGVNAPEVKSLVSVKNTHWVYMEWKKAGSDVFGPVLIGMKKPDQIRAKKFSKSRHLPIQYLLIKAKGRWVVGTLNKVD